MALVDYPSSEEDEKEDAKSTSELSTSTSTSSNLKRKRGNSAAAAAAAVTKLPPLPSQFHDLYASTTRPSTKDDPSMHGGRKRVTPHIEGNWPTHLYIEWYPSTTEATWLNALITTLQAANAQTNFDSEIHSSLTSELGVPLPLHISLSRSLGFSAEKKGEFVDALERAIRASGIKPFHVQFKGIDWVANFEKTRWFLVLRLQMPEGNGLNRLLSVCNNIAEDRAQPSLYKPPRGPEKITKSIRAVHSKPVAAENLISTCHDASDAFHFSIAWTLTQPSQELRQATETVSSNQLDRIKNIKVKVAEIKARVGNIVSNMPLTTDRVVQSNLFGI